jgi:SulP family sulfate permease
VSAKHIEIRAGIEAALQGLPAALVPILLFQGVFGSAGLAAGFWAALVAATAAAAVSLLMRGQPAMLFGSRGASLSVYVALILHLVHALPNASDNAITVAQLITAMAVASLLYLGASALIVLVALARVGNVFRMIPAPVNSGIANGTALGFCWLAFHHLMSGTGGALLTAAVMVFCFLAHRPAFLEKIPSVVIALVCGVAIAIIFEPTVTPVSGAAAPGTHWLSWQLWQALPHTELVRLLIAGLPGALTLALVLILETFTTAGMMQTRFGVRIEPDRELMILGVSNAVSAVFGGAPLAMNPVRSLANWIAGGRTRLSSVVALLFTGFLLLVAGDWLIVLPAGMVAGLLLIQACLQADRVFLVNMKTIVSKRQWLIDGRLDIGFWIAFSMALVAFFGSLVWACSVGIALSSLVVLRRVSTNLTARWAYMDQVHSRRVRSASEIANLQRMARRVAALRLTGHLFFGNSARLTQLVDELHVDARCVVVDVARVTDVDPSGAAAIAWIIKALKDRKVTVLLSGLALTRSTELRQVLDGIEGVQTAVDLDRGLEACEEMVLQNSTVMALPLTRTPLQSNVLLQDLSPGEVAHVLALGEHRTVEKNHPLFKRDALADGIWLLEEGMVSILANDSTVSARLSTFGPGQFVGEMGFIDGKTRSATAMADSTVMAFLLHRQAIETLVREQPATAVKITRNIARELSYRVRSTSALVAEEASDDPSGWHHSTLGQQSPG